MLELRTFEKDDCEHLTKWIPDSRFLLQWAGPQYSFPLTVAQLEDTFRKTQKASPEHLMFKAVLSGNEEIVGHIELMRIDRKRRGAHIGRVLICNPENRKKGYGSTMVSQMVGLAFNAMDIKELCLNVFDFNKPAIACYTKIGFRFYDSMDSPRIIKGEHWNLISMKLSKDYWLDQLDSS
jgi:RimJ/RimL family protein N-acetyltransferase